MTWKSLLAASALFVALAGTLGFYWPFGLSAPALQLPGVVEIQEVRLGSKVGGRVKEVCTREGKVVEEDQVLVRFEAPELEAQRQQWQGQVQMAEAELDKSRHGPRREEKEAARAAVAAARARLRRLQAGARPEEIEQAASDYAGADTELKWARQKLERIRRLTPTLGASAEEYDASTAALSRAQAQLGTAAAKLKLLQAGSRLEEIDEAAAELRRVQANSDLLDAGTRPEEVAVAEAKVVEMRGKLREVEANLAEAVVRAPGRAVVEVLAVRKGDLVPPNQPILRVLKADDLWVKVYVPETQLGKVRLHQAVEVRIDSYPDKHFDGTVEQIASESEFTPRNVQSADERRHQVFGIKVRVADPDGVFKSGMAADVRVPLAE
jgi:multidrug resistance efflux pump